MKRFLSVFLIFCLFFSIKIDAAETKVITGINDKIVDYKKFNEPITFGGQICVPYTAFLEGLDVMYVYNKNNNNLVLYNFDHIITFDIKGRTIRDEKLNYYSGEAFYRGTVLYVPAETVCEIFDFDITKIYGSVEIVRMTNGRQSLSDEVFSVLVDQKLKQVVTPPPPVVSPPSGQGTTVTKPIVINDIYPVFLGDFSENTISIIDRLGENQATFFVNSDFDDETLRYLYINDHNFGIYVPKDKQNHNIMEYIEKVNSQIFDTVYQKTRLVILEDGNNEFNDLLMQNGYVNFDVDIDLYSTSLISGSKDAIIDMSNTNVINGFVSFCKENHYKIKPLTEFS